MTEYKIKDLKNGMKEVDIVVEIDFLGEKRTSSGFGADNFRQAYVKDETGEIKLTFWNEDIQKAKPKKKVKITNGYVTVYNMELQLNASKDNPLEFL